MIEKIRSLKVEKIRKEFPGVVACDDISLSVGENEILALVGENGAGKTTLMNILMGLYQPDSGEIYINEKAARLRSPKEAFDLGIGMVHQRYMLVPNLTVAENIALGMRQAHSSGLVKLERVRQRIREIDEYYGLYVAPDAYVWQLSVGEQQRVELIKTLCYGARFLILDEPTSALTPQEIDELIKLLRNLIRDLSIIFISHKLNEVKELSHKVSILRHGRVVFNGDTENHTPGELAAFMTGNPVELPVNEETASSTEPALSLEQLKVKSDRGFYALNGLNLTIHSGEIVGLAGVSGNGQRELAEVINGLRKVESGKIIFKEKEITNKSPQDIIDLGMGYVPEDRNTEGIVPPFSIWENIILKDSHSKRFSIKSFLRLKHIAQITERLRSLFDIRSPNINVSAGSLSGGNIQKVILAREIDRRPNFLIAVYPTRGLDMGAIEFIHKQLLDIKKSGIGILLISEELDEIRNLSDRIAVIFKGKIEKVLSREEATNQKIGLLMAGVKDA